MLAFTPVPVMGAVVLIVVAAWEVDISVAVEAPVVYNIIIYNIIIIIIINMPSPNPALAPALSAGEAARAPALVTRLHHLRVGHRHQPHLL